MGPLLSCNPAGEVATAGWRLLTVAKRWLPGDYRQSTSAFRLNAKNVNWLRGRDLNPRPLGYEPNELPDCSTPRHCVRTGLTRPI